MHIDMKKKPITNYLRMHRRRNGLTQDDVAFLLGAFCRTVVSRHEYSGYTPKLGRALAFELIFDTRARDLYPEEFAAVEATVKGRAKKLLERVKREPDSVRRARRLALLKGIIRGGGSRAA